MRLLLALSLIPAMGWAQNYACDSNTSECHENVIYVDHPYYISCEAPCIPHGPRNAEGNVQLLNGTWVNPSFYQCEQQVSGTISSTMPCKNI